MSYATLAGFSSIPISLSRSSISIQASRSVLYCRATPPTPHARPYISRRWRPSGVVFFPSRWCAASHFSFLPPCRLSFSSRWITHERRAWHVRIEFGGEPPWGHQVDAPDFPPKKNKQKTNTTATTIKTTTTTTTTTTTKSRKINERNVAAHPRWALDWAPASFRLRKGRVDAGLSSKGQIAGVFIQQIFTDLFYLLADFQPRLTLFCSSLINDSKKPRRNSASRLSWMPV